MSIRIHHPILLLCLSGLVQTPNTAIFPQTSHKKFSNQHSTGLSRYYSINPSRILHCLPVRWQRSV